MHKHTHVFHETQIFFFPPPLHQQTAGIVIDQHTVSPFSRLLDSFIFFLGETGTVTLYSIDPAVQSAMRTSGKARRLYSYLWGCNSQLYNLLPQPRSKQTWTQGLQGSGGLGTQRV